VTGDEYWVQVQRSDLFSDAECLLLSTPGMVVIPAAILGGNPAAQAACGNDLSKNNFQLVCHSRVLLAGIHI